MNDSLQPVLVSGFGRSGSTAMMALLATAPEIAMNRQYPFEHRFLTRLVKAAALADRFSQGLGFSDEQLFDFESSSATAEDGRVKEAAFLRAHLPRQTIGRQTLIEQWRLLAAPLRAAAPGATLYAEKAPAWVVPQVRSCFPVCTLYLFRDPRDVFLSANEFIAKRQHLGFGRRGDSDLEHARNLAYEYLGFFENYRADRHRPDTAFITYRELVQDAAGLAQRLNQRLKTSISSDAASKDFLDGHRTSATPTHSLDRWKKERLAPEVTAILEQHLHEPMSVFGFEFSAGRAPLPLECDFTNAEVQRQIVASVSTSQGRLCPAGEDGLRVEIADEDFHFSLPSMVPFQAHPVREIWMSLTGDVGDHCSIYWRNPRGGFSEKQAMHVCHSGGSHWRIVCFPVGTHPLWKDQIAELRIDPLNGERPPAPRIGHLRWVRLVG